MEFESPDVEKDFPGLYASESGKKSNESDFSDEAHERISKKDLLIGKRKDKKDSKKDRGYATLEGESSPEEDTADIRSPSKTKKSKPFKFPSKKEKREKSREKDSKEKDSDKDKEKKKDSDKEKDKKKEFKTKLKLKERKKLKHGEESLDIAEEQPIFGVSLVLALERNRCHDGVEIPVVIRDCINHIQDAGLCMEGLYKVSGIKSKVHQVRRMYNQRENVCIADYDIPVCTSLLKLFMRDLPETIVTTKLANRFDEAACVKDMPARESELKALVQSLPACNRLLLGWLARHLADVVAHEKQNKMSVQNLSLALSQSLQMSQKLICALLHHCEALFSDIKLTKYVAPLLSGSPGLPESAAAITEELSKQESLLGQIHCEMNAGFVTKQREELLWEVQRMITQLKRKLRTLERGLESSSGQRVNEPTSDEADGGPPNPLVLSSSSCKRANTAEEAEGGGGSGGGGGGVEEEGGGGEEEEEVAISCSAQSPTTSEAPPPIINNNHVVEAIIESNDSALSSSSSAVTQEGGFSKDSSAAAAVVESVDELALCLETEELLALAVELQTQLANECAQIAAVRAEIARAGGDPHYSTRLLRACAVDSYLPAHSTPTQVGPLVAEWQVLLQQKATLTQAIIDERANCLSLRVQIKHMQIASS